MILLLSCRFLQVKKFYVESLVSSNFNITYKYNSCDSLMDCKAFQQYTKLLDYKIHIRFNKKNPNTSESSSNIPNLKWDKKLNFENPCFKQCQF